ncbi:hypothetical protein ES703_87245 [subsurface metagenome]
MIICSISNDLCACNIIFDSFSGVELHQRYVLVSGCVNNDLRFILFEDFVHADFVGNVTNERFYADCRKLLMQFLLYIEQRIFSLLNEQKQLRI